MYGVERRLYMMEGYLMKNFDKGEIQYMKRGGIWKRFYS